MDAPPWPRKASGSVFCRGIIINFIISIRENVAFEAKLKAESRNRIGREEDKVVEGMSGKKFL